MGLKNEGSFDDLNFKDFIEKLYLKNLKCKAKNNWNLEIGICDLEFGILINYFCAYFFSSIFLNKSSH